MREASTNIFHTSGPIGRFFSALLILVVLILATNTRNAEWADELSIFQDTIRKSPNKVRPYYRLGMEFGKRQDVEMAFRYFRKVQELDPTVIPQWVQLDVPENIAMADYVAALVNPGERFARTVGHSSGNDGERYDNNPGHLLLRIASSIRQGKNDEAQRMIDNVLAADPSMTDAYLARAEIEMRLGRTDRMADAYSMAIARGKDAPPKDQAYIGLGSILGKQGKYEESAELFKKAIRIRPSVLAHSNLSISYRNMGMFDASIREQEKARLLDRK
jgi:tetratricopeptide (TPR) repeat protein